MEISASPVSSIFGPLIEKYEIVDRCCENRTFFCFVYFEIEEYKFIETRCKHFF